MSKISAAAKGTGASAIVALAVIVLTAAAILKDEDLRVEIQRQAKATAKTGKEAFSKADDVVRAVKGFRGKQGAERPATSKDPWDRVIDELSAE